MKLYNDYNSYLKARYGCKIYKIGLDAGFTCPNRDGTKGTSGCIYCNESGSRSVYAGKGNAVYAQLTARIKFMKEKYGAKKFIAYFQAFTNTYAPAERLKKTYDAILPFEEIVGLSIGTRPDAVNKDKLKMISSYTGRYDTWMEYGLQSIHNKTLERINRGHTFEDFMISYRLTKEFKLPVCVHLILGLPGETKKDMIETAEKLSELKVDGVKIHILHVLRGSTLEKLYAGGKVKLLSQDEYVGLAADLLEHLPKETIVQRLTGQGKPEEHIAPEWAFRKTDTIMKIEEELRVRGSRQGSKS